MKGERRKLLMIPTSQRTGESCSPFQCTAVPATHLLHKLLERSRSASQSFVIFCLFFFCPKFPPARPTPVGRLAAAHDELGRTVGAVFGGAPRHLLIQGRGPANRGRRGHERRPPSPPAAPTRAPADLTGGSQAARPMHAQDRRQAGRVEGITAQLETVSRW